MSNIDPIKKRIEQIENLLKEVKYELDKISEEKSSKKEVTHKDEIIPTDEVLHADYEGLYIEFRNGNFANIQLFIKSKSKNYLKSFCRANSLPIDGYKASKDKIIAEVMNWLAQREAITKKVI
jgi:hypothetical protein